MARKAQKQRKIEEEAAKAAAEEAVQELSDDAFDSPEERDISRAIHEQNMLSDVDNDARDIFADGKKKAIARNSSVQFRIYRDGQWVGTKPSSYTWEKLRADFKTGGHFKVVAIDRDNQFMGSQSLEVAGIEEPEVAQPHVEPVQQQSPLQMMELMKENQREAEAKAASQQSTMATLMASVMQSITQGQQAMMQMQQQSAQQFQTLLIEMQKQSQAQSQSSNDRMMTLVTTLLTQKPAAPPPDTGVKYEQVLKLISDAETRAENRITKQYEMIEKKADALAEVKAAAMGGGDEDESFGKTVIKGFMPVLSQMMQQPQGGAQFEDLRQLGPAQSSGEEALRPGVPARDPRPRDQRRPADASYAPEALSGPRPQAAPAAPRPHQRRPTDASYAPEARSGPRPQPVRNVSGPATAAIKDSPEIVRIKKRLFDFCASDIGQGMINGEPASKVAELCLSKLEKEGVPRQTVANTFELTDFYGYADQYGLPEQAKPWLKEFHEALRANAASPVQVERPASTVVNEPPASAAAAAEPPSPSPNGAGDVNVNGRAVGTRPRSRREPVAPAGAQPRESTPNI